MSNITYILPLILCLLLPACGQNRNRENKSDNKESFAREMVEFVPFAHNPLFSGTNSDTWDKLIRERGFILFDDDIYKMWYTGYAGNDSDQKYLGYATSIDGINWTRYDKNPTFSQKWTEDMFVMKHDSIFYMYAEGENDIAHLLTSVDGIKWEERGDLVIITVNGDTIQGPYGTPAVIIEDGQWYLFYERNDEAIWLAKSKDYKTWTNVVDEPVLRKGPEDYDSGAVACNQIFKYMGKYYMYYHGSSDTNWAEPGSTSIWTSNVAVSIDLVNWEKYPGNPIVEGDHSSPVIVPVGDKFRLYTVHHEVWLYYSE
jgi:hypothetical protein